MWYYLLMVRTGVVFSALFLWIMTYLKSTVFWAEMGHQIGWQKFTHISKEYTISIFRVRALYLLGIHFSYESECNMFLQNISKLQLDYTVLTSQKTVHLIATAVSHTDIFYIPVKAMHHWTVSYRCDWCGQGVIFISLSIQYFCITGLWLHQLTFMTHHMLFPYYPS